MPAMENETEYGIAVVNRFAGLDTEANDPFDYIEMAQQKEKVLKADKKQGKGVKGGAKSQVIAMKETVIEDIKKDGLRSDKSERTERGDQRGRGGRGRGGRGRGGRGRGAGGDRPPREGRGDGQSKEHQEAVDDGEQKGERRTFGERRGGFGERRERRGFGGERRGFGERQGFGERRTFGGDSEGAGERRSFGNTGDSLEQQDDGYGRRGGRGRPRGRARGRGGRGREFDRHSGNDRSSASSSVKATDKRDGSGSYNWGSAQDEIEASEDANVVTPMDEEIKGSWADAAEQSENQEESAGEGGDDVNKEDEVKEMSLDEYKSLLEKEKPQVAYNVRQANEGEKGFPKNAVTLKKLSENEQESSDSFFFPKRVIEEKFKTSGRVKEVLPFDLKYAAVDSRLTSGGSRGNRRGRGSRGSRGLPRKGGRDGGDRGDDRAGFGEKEGGRVDRYDEDFPDLR